MQHYRQISFNKSIKIIFSVSPPVQWLTSTSKQLVYELRKNAARTATRRDAELNEKSTHPWRSRTIHGFFPATSPPRHLFCANVLLTPTSGGNKSQQLTPTPVAIGATKQLLTPCNLRSSLSSHCPPPVDYNLVDNTRWQAVSAAQCVSQQKQNFRWQ